MSDLIEEIKTVVIHADRVNEILSAQNNLDISITNSLLIRLEEIAQQYAPLHQRLALLCLFKHCAETQFNEEEEAEAEEKEEEVG